MSLRISHSVMIAVMFAASAAALAADDKKDAPAPAPPPDVVDLKDGSRLLGEIVSQKDGVLTLKTQFAGEVKIKADAIKGVTSPRPLRFIPPQGESVVGPSKVDPQRGQVVTPPSGPEVVVQPWKEIVDPAIPPPSPWSARLEIGVLGSTGNTESFNFHGRAEANRVEPDDRLKLYTEGNYATQNGVKSKNEYFAGVRYDKDLDKSWFVYGKGEAEYDEFEQLSYRLTATGGIGYFFIREKTLELKGRVGAGYQHETFFGGATTDRPVAEAGYDFRIDLWEWLRFTNGFTYYPSLLDPAHDYRAIMETAGEVPLVTGGQWKVRAGMRNEYNASPRPGVERLDTTYFLNLVYDLK